MIDTIKAWQCIGCGKVDVPQPPCIGICQDRKVEFVYASQYETARKQAQVFEALIRRLAWTNPRPGEWERSYRVLQEQARLALEGSPTSASLDSTEPAATESKDPS